MIFVVIRNEKTEHVRMVFLYTKLLYNDVHFVPKITKVEVDFKTELFLEFV